MNSEKRAGDPELEELQRESFSYFLYETNPKTGLVIDKTATGSPASIAATGFALSAYPIAAERGFGTSVRQRRVWPRRSRALC